MAEKTAKQIIETEPMVAVRIPRAYGQDEESGDEAIQVQVNGVHQQFRRGDTVQMPAPLYLALKQTGRYDI